MIRDNTEPDSGNRHITASEFCTEDATKPNGKSEKSLNAHPWQCSKFYWAQPWKISPTLKVTIALEVVRRLTQTTSRSALQPKLPYDSTYWKDQCKFHSVADITDKCLFPYAVWLFQSLQIIPIISPILSCWGLLNLHYQWSRLHQHSATDLSKHKS